MLAPILVLDAAGCGGLISDPAPATDPADAGPPTTDAGTKPPAKPDAGKSDAGPVGIDFEPCTEPFTGDCAVVPLPLDRTAPDGEKIGVFVTRFANPENARGSLWLLQGGPGGSISSFEQAMEAYRTLYPDLVIYGMEHRGVARSSRLECNDFRCAEDLLASVGAAKLAFFSTTAAAGDLHELIALTRQPGQPNFVYGVSYGTYVAQRYLTMYPTEPTAVVLDSVVPQDGLYFSEADAQGELPFAYWAQLCDEDAFCTGKIGAPALPALRAILARVAENHCPTSKLDKANSVLLRALLPYNDLAFALMPVLYRFERCTEADAVFVSAFLDQVAQLFFGDQGFAGQLPPGFDPDDEDDNTATYLNVAFAELWETPAPPQDVLAQRFQAALLPSGGIDQLGELRATWPVYPQDQFMKVYPTTSVPVLTLNGTLDSQTPLDVVRVVEEHYQQPNQTFVVIPNANHGTAISFDGQPVPCGSFIMQGFLANPTAPLDTSCTLSPEKITFEGDPDFNRYLFGTSDLWEGEYVPNQFLRIPSPALQAKLDQLEARRRMLGEHRR